MWLTHAQHINIFIQNNLLQINFNAIRSYTTSIKPLQFSFCESSVVNNRHCTRGRKCWYGPDSREAATACPVLINCPTCISTALKWCSGHVARTPGAAAKILTILCEIKPRSVSIFSAGRIDSFFLVRAKMTRIIIREFFTCLREATVADPSPYGRNYDNAYNTPGINIVYGV